MSHEHLAAQALPELVPGRQMRALVHVVDNVMPEDWLGRASQFLQSNRARFVRGGDPHGAQRFNFELYEVERHDADLAAALRKRIFEHLRAACESCHVPEFDVRYIEMTATLHHHGGHFTWHDDIPGYTGEIVESRRLTWCYYMHTEPRLFSGGELEFLDGTKIEPRNNRLVFFHPVQQHRVREVECWSRHAINGRWAFIGWVHGDPPLGWVERLPKLRGVPASG